MIDTSAIDGFLGETLRAVRSGRSAPWIACDGQNWSAREGLTAIWSRIEVHGLSFLLHSNAKHLTGWPAAMLEAIADEARLTGLWESTHRAVTAKLVERLAGAGIVSVMTKGTALAYSIHDEPAVRRRGDSDLLVHPGDLHAVRGQLSELGWYRRNDPHGLFFQETWLHDAAGPMVHCLDLHWASSDRPALRRVLSVEDFFTFKQRLPRFSQNAWRADHAMTIIHETLNQKWHLLHGYETEEGRVTGARRLIWSLDFDLMSDALDDAGWDRLITLCEEHGVGPLVAEALGAAAVDVGSSMPHDRLTTLAKQAANPDITAYFETTDTLSEFWLDLRTASSWRERLEMVRDRGFPPRAHLIEKYPDKTGWPTALLQGRLLVEIAGRVIRRVAAG